MANPFKFAASLATILHFSFIRLLVSKCLSTASFTCCETLVVECVLTSSVCERRKNTLRRKDLQYLALEAFDVSYCLASLFLESSIQLTANVSHFLSFWCTRQRMCNESGHVFDRKRGRKRSSPLLPYFSHCVVRKVSLAFCMYVCV